MGGESDSNTYIYLVFAILGLIGFFIHKIKSKKTKEELTKFATTKSYIYHSKLDSSKTRSIGLPEFFANSEIHNYIEFPEKDWLNIWGDCEQVVKTKGAAANSNSSFFLFIFNTISIPEFEIRDNNGVIDSLANAFSGKVVKLDNEFNSSYVLKGTNERQITKFFTNKIRKAFLKMDKNHLPTERNLDASDLGSVLTLQFNKIGVSFYGKGNRLFVFCSEQSSLFGRQNLFKLASGIANEIVKEFGEETSQTSSKNENEEPQDEISQYLNSQINNFSSSPNPNNSSAQTPITQPRLNKQIPAVQPNEKPMPLNANDNSSQQISNSTEYEANEEEISPRDQLIWLSAMMIIDKDIHRNELKNIAEYGINLGVAKPEIEQIINMAKTQSANLLHSIKLAKLPKNEKLMRMLIRVAFADGKIAPEELEFIRFAAKKMNYQENELKSLLTEEKNNFTK